MRKYNHRLQRLHSRGRLLSTLHQLVLLTEARAADSSLRNLLRSRGLVLRFAAFLSSSHNCVYHCSGTPALGIQIEAGGPSRTLAGFTAYTSAVRSVGLPAARSRPRSIPILAVRGK